MSVSTAEIVAAVKAAMANPASLQKDWTQPGNATSGLAIYDLEAPAKSLFPVITPFRNMLPRVSGRGGIQANWRAITGINTGNVRAGVGQGNRGGVIATSVQAYNAAYKGIGLEDFVTFEADYAAQGYQDIRATAVLNTLRALMLQEEGIIVGGNTSLALGTTPTPSLTASSSGGSLGSITLSVICVALALDGYSASSVAGGCVAEVTRTNADGSQDTYGGGAARKSSAATAAITGPNGSCAATVTPVAGAVAYAWYWGTSGNEALGAITTINSVSITANAAGTQLASAMPTADHSQNSLVFDGLLTMCMNASYGAHVKTMATGTAGTGTPLTGDTKGGIVEIDEVLKYLWDNFRLSPTSIWVNAQEQANISSKVLAGSANASSRFTFNVDQGIIAGGTMVRSYLNKFTMEGAQEIPIRLHPTLPPGTMLFYTETLPYPLSNVSNVAQILTRRDYYQQEWPLRTRKYEYGVYADEVLQHYFPPSMAVIRNIGNG